MIDTDPYTEKIHVARAQLRTALWLFIEERDPISVHVLACGACEILAEVTEATNTPSPSENLRQYLAAHEPQTKPRALRNANWNAFKHVSGIGNLPRDDGRRIRQFSDAENDALLFQGWWDLDALDAPVPIEAKLYVLWYFGHDPAGSSAEQQEAARHLFPFAEATSREESKRQLRAACRKWRECPEVVSDDDLDHLPLSTPITLSE